MDRMILRDACPVSDQVRDGLRHLMVTGVIREGERLPSIQALARSLAINPVQIRRACLQLESERFLCPAPDGGWFAAPRSAMDERRRQDLLASFDRAAAELLYLGLTSDQLAARIRTLKGGEHV